MRTTTMLTTARRPVARRALAPAVGLLAALVLVGCGADGAADDDGDGAPPADAAVDAPDDADTGSSGVTGTVTFDGADVGPLDGLSCVTVPGDGQKRIAGSVGVDGEDWLQLQENSARYEVGEVTWVTTSGDNRGELAVDDDGASGALLLYEEGTANDLGEQEFFEMAVDLRC